MKRYLAASLMLSGLSLLGVSPAGAKVLASKSWGPITNIDNNVSLGSASGTTGWRDDFGDQIYVDFSSVKDRKVNSHATYGQVDWAFNGSYCYVSGISEGGGSISCNSGWYGDGSNQTSRTNAEINPAELRKNLKLTADSARAGSKVCEDRGTFGRDKCSAQKIIGFSY